MMSVPSRNPIGFNRSVRGERPSGEKRTYLLVKRKNVYANNGKKHARTRIGRYRFFT